MKRTLSAARRGFVAAVCVVVFAGITRAAEPALRLDTDANTLTTNLETSIPELMKKGRVPGLQVAVIRDGNILFHEGFGVLNAETGAPVTDDTIFEAASLTKPLFAYAVMMLIEEGVLDLDTPLITHFTPEEIENFLGHPLDKEGFHREWAEVITARHVLSHSAGTPHGEGGEVYPLFFEPGTQYKYSAAGYFFLQRAVEKLKGEPLDVIIENYVLGPLGMTHSSMVWREAYENTMANGHDLFGKPQAFRKRTEPNAAASLYTTAADYARFVCAVLNGEGLKSETLKEMLTGQIVVDEEMGLTWSLGFAIQEDGNGRAFWQWGDYGIFRNYVLAYPKQKLGVVYLTNSFYGLSVCQDLISDTIGGQALGVAFLNYRRYDSPLHEFVWTVDERGADVVETILPEMKSRYPDEFSEETLAWIGGEFNDAGRFEEGIAILKFNVKENPESPNTNSTLARAYLVKGDREQAKRYYDQVLVLAADDEEFDTTPVEWAMAYIKAFDEPVTVPADHLQALVGDYGARHIQLRDGALYYLRDGTARTEYTKLTPLSKDMFVLEGVVYFRLQFEYDDAGRPTKVIGLYDSGYRDESIRDE